MADQVVKCVSCGKILATVTGDLGPQALNFPEKIQIKQLHDGTAFICPKCGALTPVDEELLKNF